MSTATNYIGKSVKRVEDKRFTTGKGKYTDDIMLPGMTYGAFVRSPYAHAKIKKVDYFEGEGHDRCGSHLYRCRCCQYQWCALRMAG